MTTLYAHLMPSHYRAQMEGVGVLGGVTVGEHPVTGSPGFFVHPCRTAGVMGEVVEKADEEKDEEKEEEKEERGLSGEEYLVLWMGVVGGCVGLYVPGVLMMNEKGTGE